MNFSHHVSMAFYYSDEISKGAGDDWATCKQLLDLYSCEIGGSDEFLEWINKSGINYVISYERFVHRRSSYRQNYVTIFLSFDEENFGHLRLAWDDDKFGPLEDYRDYRKKLIRMFGGVGDKSPFFED